MKRKKIIVISAAVALILCVSLAISNVLSLKITAVEQSKVFSVSSMSDEEFSDVKSKELTLENEKFLMTLDCETTHFTIKHKGSGKTYFSTLQPAESNLPTEEQQSELIITYYDSNSTKATMNSYENSVQGQSFEIKRTDSSIRVNYSIQKSKEKIFVPDVIGEETFETEILGQLKSGPKRRIKQFYTLFESKNSDSDTKEMKSKYEALSDENLYILNDAAVEHTYPEITKYMDMAGYNQEAYAKEVERLGLENDGDNRMPAAFVIPVEYTLSDQGLIATILTDRITSDSASYKLTNISLLPYFASCGQSQKGWFLVPDGSGAIINFAEKAGSTYSQNIWGTDFSVESEVKPTLMQNAGMPVWGYHNGNEAMFAIVSGGAAVATVNAEVYGNEFVQNRIYTDFKILAYDTSEMGVLSNKAAINLYAKDYIEEFPQITYMLMPNENTTYSDMANEYRAYLLEKGVLSERLKDTENVPIYLDFTGYETVDESFLGISTKAKTVLSTVKDIEEALDELHNRDVKGVYIRLKAYGSGGIYGTVSNGFDIDKSVGTVEELDSLAQKLLNDGTRLYLDNNISSVYETGNSFKKMTHAVRNLKKTVSKAIDYDLVARINEEAHNKYYMTSPAYFNSLTNNFAETLKKESENPAAFGYSWSDFGSKLWSDFHTKTYYDRTQSVYAALDAVHTAGKEFDSIITDGSNAYVLGSVSAVLNIPLKHSELNCESYGVPFYQMVIHGYVDYSGAPINISTDSSKTYLASVESGANLYYSFYTSGDNPLKETAAGTLIYPTDIQSSYDDVENRYAQFRNVFKELRCLTIKEHKYLEEGVFVTTYENETQIVVNYNNHEVTVNDQTIAAKGFVVVEGGAR